MEHEQIDPHRVAVTMTFPHRDIDPFQLELMKSCFDTIADDMALTLMRTAHSRKRSPTG